MIDLQHKCMDNIGNYGISDLITPNEETIGNFIIQNKEDLTLIANEHKNRMKLYENNQLNIGNRKDTMNY